MVLKIGVELFNPAGRVISVRWKAGVGSRQFGGSQRSDSAQIVDVVDPTHRSSNPQTKVN